MNGGVIAVRYAKALLSYVQEVNTGEKTYSQVVDLVRKIQAIGKLESYLCKHPEIPFEKKCELLVCAIESPLTPELEKFIKLVNEHRQMEYLLRIFQSFIEQYQRACGIRVGRLVCAAPVEGLCEKLEQLLTDKVGLKVVLEEEINPDILGGFVLEVDGIRLDASVQDQLRRLRRELIENKNRIV